MDLFAGEVAIENPGAPLILKAPLRICAVGSSGSGKTSALLKCVFLPEESPHDIIIWCAPSASLRQVKLQNAKEVLDERAAERGLAEGLIEVECDGEIDKERVEELLDQAFELGLTSLVVFDDLYTLGGKDQAYIAGLFTNGRHRLASVAELRQRVFGGGGNVRDVRLNCNAFLLAEFGQLDEIRRLAGQITASRAEADQMVRYYQTAVEKPHGFLLVDLQNKPPWRFRNSSLERGFK